MSEDIPPFHHHHPPIYSVNRSTVNAYKIDSGGSVRVRSVWVSASFNIFALTAGGGDVLGGEGNCLGGVNVL